MSNTNQQRSNKEDVVSCQSNRRQSTTTMPGVPEFDPMIQAPRRNENFHVNFGSMRTLYEGSPPSMETNSSSEHKSLCTYLSEKLCFFKKN